MGVESGEWRFIDSGALDGAANMALDEAMFLLKQEQKIPSTLRLYQWSPPALSLGYFQKPGHSDLLSALTSQFSPTPDIVRRLTGGGAILHDKELTFCLVASIKEFPGLENVHESYRIISKAIILGLKSSGIEASLRSIQSRQAGPEPFLCFARPSLYDIVINGEKLAGSAQRRTNGTLMHHGSILLERHGIPGTIAVNEQGKRNVSILELKENIRNGFENIFSLRCRPGVLTEKETQMAARIQESKRAH